MSLNCPSSPVLSKPDINTALLQSDPRSIDKELKKRRLSFFAPVPMESPARSSVDSELEEECCNSPHVHFGKDHVQIFDGSTTPCLVCKYTCHVVGKILSDSGAFKNAVW